MKPRSIQLFDQFYLGALAVGFVSTIAYWDQTVAMVLAQPGMPYGPGFFMFTTAAGFLVSLLLWFLTSVRASKVAKWILVVFFGLGAVGFVIGFAVGSPVGGLQLVLGLTGMLLQGAAVWMLFRPDAKPWFSGRRHDADIFR